MNPTYTTFDTLTIGSLSTDLTAQNKAEATTASMAEGLATNPSPQRREPTVVARLPRLNNKLGAAEEQPTQPGQSDIKSDSDSATNVLENMSKNLLKQRIDRAASPLHRNGQRYSAERPEGSTDKSSNDESSRNQALNKLQIFREGYRLDTFSETEGSTQFDASQLNASGLDSDVELKLAVTAETQPNPTQKRAATVGFAAETDHWSDNWLLRLEAAVMPYSRLIVLVAVVAALGLTFLLLQGNPAGQLGDAIKPTPMADHLLKTSSLTGLEAEQEATIVEAPNEVSIFAVNNSAVTRSSGPTGLPAPVIINTHVNSPSQASSASQAASAPQAQLAGSVMPIEPYRTTNQIVQRPTPVETSTNRLPVNYPHTANASSQWPTASQGGTIR